MSEIPVIAGDHLAVGMGNTYVTPVLNAGATYTAKASVGCAKA